MTNTVATRGAVLMPTLGERMKMALDYAGIPVATMAAELEVTPASTSRWLNDKMAVRGLVLRVWAERTGVNEEWLRTGDVPAGATILEGCARRDSNPQPSDP